MERLGMQQAGHTGGDGPKADIPADTIYSVRTLLRKHWDGSA